MNDSVFIHESSYVDDGVEIGDGTKVWHFCHLLPHVRIGKRCNIGQNVVVGPHVTIGNGVKIQNNVSVYRGVTLEDNVFCGPSMVFTNIMTPRAAFPRNRPEDDRPTLVRQGASIGANATIVCGVTIGRHAMIGAGSVVTRDVPDYALFFGNPARHRGWACCCGGVLRESSPVRQLECPECRRRYQAAAAEVLLPLTDDLISANAGQVA